MSRDRYRKHRDELLKVLEVYGREAFDDQVGDDWWAGRDLFEFASKGGLRDRDSQPGCLTMIRKGFGVAATPELTTAIRADERVPTLSRDITPESLDVFVEWQERLYDELGRDS